jgi:YD repeat-containing protein
LGRLIAVYDTSGNASVYNYDAVGNLLSITNDSSTQFAGIGLSSGLVGSTLTIYGTYTATVAWLTSMPSFRSSPWYGVRPTTG